MPLLFKMQKALVTFCLKLIIKVRILFIFLWRRINLNLFELIHLNKNMKRNERSNPSVFEISLSAYTKE